MKMLNDHERTMLAESRGVGTASSEYLVNTLVIVYVCAWAVLQELL